MKRLLVPAALIGLFVATLTTPVKAQTSDDVYYSPKDNTTQDNNSTTTAPAAPQRNQENYNNNNYNQGEQSYPDNYSTQRYQNSTSSYATDSTTGNTYVTNNYYGPTSGGGFNPYMNYSYDLFYSGIGFGLYDQIYPGFGLGIGYGFGYPYYSPFYNPFYYPYYGYGFGYYGEGGYYGGGISSYYGPRRSIGAVVGSRSVGLGVDRGVVGTVGAPRGISNTTDVARTSARSTNVPFARPSGIATAQSGARQGTAARTNMARGNYYHAAGNTAAARSGGQSFNRGNATTMSAQRSSISRNFAPRGGFSSYQNNRSISGTRSGFANRSYNGIGSARSSYSGGSRSSGSFSGGGSRGFSGGGSGSRGHR